eukprot:TRINITY_DN29849_c0_g1_i1.p1 TRINITY_DN29849_c0_g1~~TRINITY_DN29849_c0_g1_i1.p1  ORF type:complete len:351 (-),score=74.64 TRINITY_DN29849_c0_g1_i1:57-1109(-)
MVRVAVSHLSGRVCLETDAGTTTTALDLKMQLHDLLGVPPVYQAILSESATLDDHDNLVRYDDDGEQPLCLRFLITMEKALALLQNVHASDESKKGLLQGLLEPGMRMQTDCSRVAAAALEDASQVVRRSGAEVLAKVAKGNQFAIDQVIQRLQHSSEETRSAALVTLQDLVVDHGNENVVAALVRCLRDSKDAVVAKAATMLETLAGKDDAQVVGAMVRLLESNQSSSEIVLVPVLSALSKLVACRSEKVIVLAAANLEHRHPCVRRWAVECLAAVSQRGDRLAIKEVAERLAHDQDHVRLAADLALTRVVEKHDEFAIDTLAELCLHADSGVRAAARIAHGRLSRGSL